MGMAFDSAPFNEDSYMESEFLRLKKRYDIKHVVETGTYHGITTCWLAKTFNYVYTTEINPSFYTTAQNRFEEAKVGESIKSYQGDSVSLLPTIISKIKEIGGNALLFLDAHWYENPLLGELEQIAACKIKPPVICIHDMQNPWDLSMGYDEYPGQGIVYTFEWVKSRIDAIYGADGYDYYYNIQATGARRGALFIVDVNTDGYEREKDRITLFKDAEWREIWLESKSNDK